MRANFKLLVVNTQIVKRPHDQEKKFLLSAMGGIDADITSRYLHNRAEISGR